MWAGRYRQGIKLELQNESFGMYGSLNHRNFCGFIFATTIFVSKTFALKIFV